MRVTVLGCGASSGVPIIGCKCAVCTSDNPKNNRRRVSVLVEEAGKKILIDTSPDLRQQALDNNLSSVDAILYTHEHGDHTHGLDETKRFSSAKKAPIPVYGDERTIEVLKARFSYAFRTPDPKYGWMRTALTPNIITAGTPFEVEGVKIIPFTQIHDRITTLGYRIGDFAYTTDANQLTDEAFEVLAGVKLWIVDCQDYEQLFNHSHVAQTLEWIEKVGAEKAILTHMGHKLEYEKLASEVPAHVAPGYDNMVLEI